MAGALAGGPVANTGTASTLTATGPYAPFAGTLVAYKAPLTNITDNPGSANGGGAGSYGLEYGFSRTALACRAARPL